MKKEELTKCYCGHTTNCDCSPEVNSPTIKVDKYSLSGDIGFVVPKKDRTGMIVDWIHFDSKDELQSYYEQMEKEVHQNRSNLNE